ncbi:MAG: hypothetical protein M3513_12960, partial [Actinomycetota bacterium]|nr:hypothetical protein [Actinomycetota bacterium]
MFERFTDQARRAVVLAQQESRRLGHDHIGTGHLLLALLHDADGGDDGTAQVLAAAGATLSAARPALQQRSAGGSGGTGHIPLTPRLKRAL